MKKYLKGVIFIIILGFLIPQNLIMPVEGATSKDYNQDSFWYYPWGKSITHKGVDVFAKKGTRLNSSTYGFVYDIDENPIGGRTIWILGPKWRIHYYAHLDEISIEKYSFVTNMTEIGVVGDSGNAKVSHHICII